MPAGLDQLAGARVGGVVVEWQRARRGGRLLAGRQQGAPTT
jgi:hypothetical protein